MTDGYVPDPREVDPDDPAWRVGWVIFDVRGEKVYHGQKDMSEDEAAEWLPRKTQIMMVELFAPLLALRAVPEPFRHAKAIALLDSEAAEGALVRGYSAKEDVCDLVGEFWAEALSLDTTFYLDRTPTDSNPADGPSRDDSEELLCRGSAPTAAPCLL